MALYLVTGLPGAGKSTINNELNARGFESYDGDKDNLARWYNDKTGLSVEVERQDCTPEFLSAHSRNISREIVESLALRAQNKHIFLCGAHENEDELYDLFSKVFALVLDEETRSHRLEVRPDSEWGKYPHEIEYSLAFKKRWEDFCKKFDHISVDATRPSKDIVDFILQEVYG